MKSLDAHEIVHTVLEAFRGLPAKLASITDKSASWYQSHGRTPKTDDPVANGNCSAVTHYMRFARLYETAEPGSGRMLSNRVYAALDAEFAARDLLDSSQSELHIDVIDETCDVEKWLARFDLENASRKDLLEFETECDEAIEAVLNAKSKARARIRNIELQRRQANV